MINYDYDSPRYSSGTTKLRVWDAIKTIVQYLALFVMSVYGCHLYGSSGNLMLQLLVAAGISSIIAYIMTPSGDTEGSVESVRRNLFLYNIASIGGYYLISSVTKDGAAISLGLLNGTIGNVIKGYLPTVLGMLLIMTPITHIFYEIKRIYTYNRKGYGKVTKRKRMEQLQRTIVK